MTNHPPPNICPHCNQPIQDEEAKVSRAAIAETPAMGEEEAREYDHRGVPLPRRTRMGGIITPQ